MPIRPVLPVLIAMLILAAAGHAYAQEPTPTPTGTPPASATAQPACEPIVFEGPATRRLNEVQVEVPSGSYGLSIPAPGTAGMPFRLCHVQTGAVLTLSGVDCDEISRSAPDIAATAVIEAILDSCVVLPPPTPETPPFRCPAGDPVAEGAADGGRTIVIGDAIEVTLPAGGFVLTTTGDTVAICSVDDGYALGLSLTDCHRVDIRPPNDPNAAVTDAIQDSCVVLNPAPPGSTPVLPTPDGSIRPPSTGDAGISTED